LPAITARRPDSGKTLLTKTIAAPAVGESLLLMAIDTDGRSRSEIRRQLVALGRFGPAVAGIDNVRGRLDDPALAMYVTAGRQADRAVKTSDLTVAEIRTMLILNGNGVELSAELSRRSIPIVLQPRVAPPVFGKPDLLGWMRDNRDTILMALLTMVVAWINAGKPYNGRRLPSFESWSEIVGGVLEVAGIAGFLKHSRSELLSQSDRDLENLVGVWAAIGGNPMTAGSLLALAQQSGTVPRAIVHAKQLSQSLGMLLSKHEGEVINDCLLTSRFDSHSKQFEYALRPIAPAPAPACAPHVSSVPSSAAPPPPSAPDAGAAGAAGAFPGVPPQKIEEQPSNKTSNTWMEVPASTRGEEYVDREPEYFYDPPPIPSEE
jgi:hypothetical protein